MIKELDFCANTVVLNQLVTYSDDLCYHCFAAKVVAIYQILTEHGNGATVIKQSVFYLPAERSVNEDWDNAQRVASVLPLGIDSLGSLLETRIKVGNGLYCIILLPVTVVHAGTYHAGNVRLLELLGSGKVDLLSLGARLDTAPVTWKTTM